MQTRKVYVIANPKEGTASTSTPSSYSSPSPQYQDKPEPSPPYPNPINTNILKQKHKPHCTPSDCALPSPQSLTSSPALEIISPPGTPGQKCIPSIDLSRVRSISSRKLPFHLTAPGGNLVVTTCHRQREACAPFLLIVYMVHLTFAFSSQPDPLPQTQKPYICPGEAVADRITGARNAAHLF